MTTKIYKPTLAAGQVYARIAGSAAALAPIGNVSELVLAINETTKKLQDYTKGGGGTYAQAKRVESVACNMKLHDLNATNLARALFGTETAVAGATVTDEAHTAYKGGLIRLAHPGATAVGVALASAPSTPIAASGNYEVRAEGVFVLDDAAAIDDGDALLIDYTHPAYDLVEALTSSAKILELSFGGVNEADSGNPVIVDLFRVQIGAAKNLGLINDNFAELQVEGEVLVDPSKTGAGTSRFFRVQMV